MAHLDPDRLALIALGEPAVDAERAHLEECDTCALELAELEYTVVVGRATVGLGELQAPPERVWERISDELRLGGEPEETPVPQRPAARRRRGLRLVFALAASVALVLAAIGTWTLVRQAQPVEIASATLDAFPGHPSASGTAIVVERSDGRRQVEVDLDDDERGDGFREVWLITADASDLVSLGVLEGATGTFPVPAGLDLREFVLVDISQEPDDADPSHSGDSIVRGELAFT